jgi:hypothetical protein
MGSRPKYVSEMRNSIVSAAHGGYAKRHSLLVLINCAMLSIIMPLSPRRDSKKGKHQQSAGAQALAKYTHQADMGQR